MLHKQIGLLLIAAAALGVLAQPVACAVRPHLRQSSTTAAAAPAGQCRRAPEPIYEEEEDVPDLPPQGRVLPTPVRPPTTTAPRPGAVQNAPLAPPPGTSVVPQDSPPGAPLQTAPGGVANAPARDAPAWIAARSAPADQGSVPAAPATLQPGDEVVTAPPVQKVANKQAVFSGLDKITGRIISFDADIGETVQFGALRVTPRACYTRPVTEAAEHRRVCRCRGDHAQGRSEAHLRRLDLRGEPRPARDRASDLRRVAERLQKP